MNSKLDLIDISERLIDETIPRLRGDLTSFLIGLEKETLTAYNDSGPAVAIIEKSTNQVVAFVGIIQLHQGVGAAWVAGTDLIAKYPKEFTRLIKELQTGVMQELNIHRLHSEVMAKESRWINWACRLGWKPEGKLEQFYPDKTDAVLMARII